MLRQRAEFLVGKSQRLLDLPENFEVPGLGIEPRRRSVSQDREFVSQKLSRRNPRSEFLGFQRLCHDADYYRSVRSGERAAEANP